MQLFLSSTSTHLVYPQSRCLGFVLQPKIPALRVTKGCVKPGIHLVLLQVHGADGHQAAEMFPSLVAVPAALQ